MNFFPTPYPDEILYSTLGRYSIRSGNLKEIHNFEDLFSTRSSIATVELPVKLDALISNMPVDTLYTAEYFVKHHTLFPYYAAFIPPERAEEIINAMKDGNGSLTYIKLGLVSYSIDLNQYLRFCPQCFKEDIKIYGEPYWHRIHQITGVFICPKHKTPIYNSKELIRAGNRQRFINPTSDNCIVEKEIQYTDKVMEKMLWMAKDIDNLLKGGFKHKDQEWFKSQFRAKLIEKGYARMNNYIHQKKLKQDFQEFYEQEYLDLVQSPLSDSSQCWLSTMVRNNNRVTYALRYLLLARFLEIPLDTLFHVKLGWNTNSNNIGLKSIDSYKELWQERLKELAELNLSVREIATILNSTPKTIRKSIDELGITPFWKYNGGGRYIKKKYIETEEFKTKRRRSRKKWGELLDKYPDKSSNQIRQDHQSLYRWLSKYDIDWLRQHARKNKGRRNNVDWKQRDEELVVKVKQVVKEMQEGKPERITWTTVGSKLGVSGWMSKRKDKLPLTKQYIESVQESLQEFQIRKIKWGIKQLEKEDMEITLWNLVEVAGVKPRYMKSIKEDIKKSLLESGYECNFL
ncbi:TniQ family protein [Mobilitalea sibirica]|uniref:TniQ family protein n=1 Tax=Mobilitalea sibirica TaxID=1462919 RepID=A0A8J7HDS3_9FIRM|nr:TnsD family Tn7-like transposition protein [Mobilitalea sibirica]MBH1941104.1 TniQ family protein [Mobilitalea sibirica]